MDLQLNGKVALITGASRGLGKACAEMLASEGCHLSLCGRNKAKLEEVANGLRNYTVKVLTVEADLRKREENEKFVNESVAHFGGMDILINNAGAGQLSDLLSHDEGVIRESMDLMYYGPLHASRAAIPHLRTRGGGRIINISSIFGKQPGGLVDYDSVKAALNMLTKDMANYLAGDKILVNAVCPGPIKGPLWEESGGLGDQLGGFLGMPGPDAIEAFAKQNIPLGHYGDPEDVSALVAYLASPHGKFITGQAINVDGGMVKALI